MEWESGGGVAGNAATFNGEFVQMSPSMVLSQVCAVCRRSFVSITQTKRQEQDRWDHFKNR